MTALPRRLQITKNGVGDRSPKMPRGHGTGLAVQRSVEWDRV